MDARPGARGDGGRTLDGERAEGGRVLTARRVPRGQHTADLFCGHPRCHGTVGLVTYVGTDTAAIFLLRQAGVRRPRPEIRDTQAIYIRDTTGIYIRERVLRPAELLRLTPIALARNWSSVPASDQDGRAGEPDPFLSLSLKAFPCEVVCPRCQRLSVVTEKVVAPRPVGTEFVKAPVRRGRSASERRAQ